MLRLLLAVAGAATAFASVAGVASKNNTKPITLMEMNHQADAMDSFSRLATKYASSRSNVTTQSEPSSAKSDSNTVPSPTALVLFDGVDSLTKDPISSPAPTHNANYIHEHESNMVQADKLVKKKARLARLTNIVRVTKAKRSTIHESLNHFEWRRDSRMFRGAQAQLLKSLCQVFVC